MPKKRMASKRHWSIPVTTMRSVPSVFTAKTDVKRGKNQPFHEKVEIVLIIGY